VSDKGALKVGKRVGLKGGGRHRPWGVVWANVVTLLSEGKGCVSDRGMDKKGRGGVGNVGVLSWQ